ncbi:MAG: hypothetical protein ACOY3P_08900 [Planctomycetota bacterium]
MILEFFRIVRDGVAQKRPALGAMSIGTAACGPIIPSPPPPGNAAEGLPRAPLRFGWIAARRWATMIKCLVGQALLCLTVATGIAGLHSPPDSLSPANYRTITPHAFA